LRPELKVAGPPFELNEPKETTRPPCRIVRAGKGQALVVCFEHCLAAWNAHRHPDKALDLADWLFPIFDRKEGLRQSCDYVIFSEGRSALHVLLVELKGKNPGDPLPQLRSAQLLVDWILRVAAQSVGERDEPEQFEAEPRYRGVVFRTDVNMPPQSAAGGLLAITSSKYPNFEYLYLPYREQTIENLLYF